MLFWMKHKMESRLAGEISITEICRWYHPYGKKWRTKEPLDESERGEWKSWLKTQHSGKEKEKKKEKKGKKRKRSLNIQKTKIMASGPITSWQIDRETVETVTDFIFWGSKIIADGDCSHEVKRCLFLGRKLMTNLDSLIKQRHYFAIKSPPSQDYGFSNGHVWMWELHYKESWVPKNWCFSTVVLEKTLESPLDYKEIQPVHPKGNQPWISIGRTDAEAETPILWTPNAKNWLIWKDPDSGKDWRQEEKGMTEGEMVGWHH